MWAPSSTKNCEWTTANCWNFCQQKLQTDALQPGQGEVIRTLQRKKSCLAIMPTGGGKSLLWLLSTYIHNRQFRSGEGHKPLTLVIVLYKALVMSHLRDSHTWLCCLSSENEMSQILTNIEGCNLVYSTPEKIVKNLAFQHMLVQNANSMKLVAIDETLQLICCWSMHAFVQICVPAFNYFNWKSLMQLG